MVIPFLTLLRRLAQYNVAVDLYCYRHYIQQQGIDCPEGQISLLQTNQKAIFPVYW